MSLRCSECGHETEDDSRFCPNCGAPVGIGAVVAPDDAVGVADLTGVLGVRSASEGDSAPLQAVSEESVDLAGGFGVGVGSLPGAGEIEECGVHPADGSSVRYPGPDGFTTANPASFPFSSQTPTQIRASGPLVVISTS